MQCKIFSVPLASHPGFDGERQLNEFLSANNVKRVFASVATPPEGPVWSLLFLYESAGPAPAKATDSPDAATASDIGSVLNREQVRSIVALKRWRAEVAAQEGVPLYMVAQNRWLEEMVRMPVRTVEDLHRVAGLGDWRVAKYGTQIVETLKTAITSARSWPSPSPHLAGRA